MAQLLASNSYVEHKKKELAKQSGTYPKSTDPKITPKWTLTYPMKYMATDIANHKNSSAENSGANLKSAAFLAMADPRHVWK